MNWALRRVVSAELEEGRVLTAVRQLVADDLVYAAQTVLAHREDDGRLRHPRDEVDEGVVVEGGADVRARVPD